MGKAQTTIDGNLGKTPELKFSKTGKPYITLDIGCTPQRKDQNGQWQNDGDPLFIQATFWENQAETLAEINLQKGALVHVKGVLKQENWIGQDGQEHSQLTLRFPEIPNLNLTTWQTNNTRTPPNHAANAPQARQNPQTVHISTPTQNNPANRHTDNQWDTNPQTPPDYDTPPF